MVVAAAETNITIMGTEREGSSNHGPGGASSLSLSAKSSANYGNFLLAFPRPRHLGVHHNLSRSFSESNSRIRDVLSGSTHTLGYFVSIPTRNYHLLS